jgi:hypothetical protein
VRKNGETCGPKNVRKGEKSNSLSALLNNVLNTRYINCIENMKNIQSEKLAFILTSSHVKHKTR